MASDPPEYQHPEDEPSEPMTLWEAVSRLQCQLPRIVKRTDAQYGKYADLASISREILPLLGMLGLSFTCAPGFDTEGRFSLNYALEHVSGEGRIAGSYPLPNGTPQQIGSAITYARRYCLCAVTGLVADEDDDGQAAEQAPVENLGTITVDDQHYSRPEPQRTKPAGWLLSDRFAALGVNGRQERLNQCAEIIGRPIGSSSELEPGEVAAILEALQARELAG